MPNFGDSETGLSQPLLSIVGDDMDIEEVEASRVDSPPPPAPVSTPSSLQGATLHSEVPSTGASSPDSNPVELQLAAGEEQGILLGENPTGGEDQDDSPILALPRALVARQYWVSKDTDLKIGHTCGEPGNRIFQQCRRRFSSTRQLRVHAPQHYINVFCPCGKYSYQRNYVLRHQRVSRCHTGCTFAVDQASFPEYRDLMLPHVADTRKRAALAQGFPACRPIQEEGGAPIATHQPAATQPLQVVLAWVGTDARADASDLGLRPLATGKKQQSRRNTDNTHRRPATTQLPLEEKLLHLRRRLRQYEEELGQLRRRMSRLERSRDDDRQ